MQPSSTDTYRFSDSFQRKILHLFWKDYEFHNTYRDVVQPRYFENGMHMDFIRLINHYYDQYNNSPSTSAMVQEISEMCERERSKVNKKEDYIHELKRISRLKSALDKDKQYISDKVIDFGKRQALTDAILQSVDIINGKKEGNLEDVKYKVEKALQVGDSINDLGLFYFDDQKKMQQRMLRSNRKEKTIPTGIDALDQLLKGGGARGELLEVMAPPGRGKTTTMVNIGQGALLSGYNVVHLSFEMDRDRVASRYDSCFLGLDHESIINHSGTSSSKLFSSHSSGITREEYDQLDHPEGQKIRTGQLVIKDYPSGTCTIEMIDSYLTQLKAHQFSPDVLIIDYPDIMKPSRRYKDKRDELNNLYVDCRALGAKDKYDCLVVVATQSNRGSYKKKTVKADDIAEDFSKVMTADIIVSFSQSMKEKRLGEFRLFIVKARDMPDGLVIPCSINRETCQIKSTGPAEYDLDDEDDENGGVKSSKNYGNKYSKRSSEKDEAKKKVSKSVMNKFEEFKRKKKENEENKNK